MNKYERQQVQIGRLEEENKILQRQKEALEKISASYQTLRGEIEQALNNWENIKRMFEETCKEKGVPLAMSTELEFNMTGQEAIPMTYTMVIAQIETLKALKK